MLEKLTARSKLLFSIILGLSLIILFFLLFLAPSVIPPVSQEPSQEEEAPPGATAQAPVATPLEGGEIAPPALPKLPELPDISDLALEVFDESGYRNPAVYDVLAYLRRDEVVLARMGEVPLEKLVRDRYDLTDPEKIDLALSDLSELLRLSGSEYYREYWGEDQSLSFVQAAIEEVLRVDPGNVSALATKSRLSARLGDMAGSLKTFRTACESAGGEDSNAFLAELAHAARVILSSENLTSKDREAVRQTLASAGLPPDCPLSKYVDGSEAQVVFEQSVVKEDPCDLSKSKYLFESEGGFPPVVMNGELQITPAMPPQHRLILGGYRVSALSTERDVRGLLELSQTLESNEVNRDLSLISRGMGHYYAGRFAAARADFEAVMASPQAPDVPGVRTQAGAYSGLMYYEVGDYEKAEKLLSTALQDKERFLQGTFDRLQKILLDARSKSAGGGA